MKKNLNIEKEIPNKSTGINVIVPEIGISTYVMSFDNDVEHNHEYYEIFYVINGDLYHYLNNKKSVISTGDCFLLLPIVDKHYFKSINTNYVHRDIMIRKETFEEVCQPFNGLLNSINTKQFSNTTSFSIDEIEQLENMLYNFTIENDFNKKKNYGRFIILRIINKFFETFYQISTRKQSKSNIVVQNIIEAFNRTDILHGEPKDLIRDSGCSQPYLCKIFKESTGKTITEYMNETKMNHSIHYLLYGNYSINQICELVGFKSTSYFNKLFRKYYKMTPSEYKKNHT